MEQAPQLPGPRRGGGRRARTALRLALQSALKRRACGVGDGRPRDGRAHLAAPAGEAKHPPSSRHRPLLLPPPLPPATALARELSPRPGSGCRCGLGRASPLPHPLAPVLQVASLHSSGLGQAVVAALLASWGEDGWAAHVAGVQSFYRRQRDCMQARRLPPPRPRTLPPPLPPPRRFRRAPHATSLALRAGRRRPRACSSGSTLARAGAISHRSARSRPITSLSSPDRLDLRSISAGATTRRRW